MSYTLIDTTCEACDEPVKIHIETPVDTRPEDGASGFFQVPVFIDLKTYNPITNCPNPNCGLPLNLQRAMQRAMQY